VRKYISQISQTQVKLVKVLKYNSVKVKVPCLQLRTASNDSTSAAKTANSLQPATALIQQQEPTACSQTAQNKHTELGRRHTGSNNDLLAR